MTNSTFTLHRGVPTIPDSYTLEETEVILMVFDNLIDLLVQANNLGVNHDLSESRVNLLTAIVDVQDNEGVAGLRTMALRIGLQIQRSYESLSGAGLLHDKEFVFDLEVVPNLISEVHARLECFPENIEPWFIALCDELEIDDPRKAENGAQRTEEFVRIRDQLPFMFDLLLDTGGAKANPKLAADIRTSVAVLIGGTVSKKDKDCLLSFIDEVEKNGQN